MCGNRPRPAPPTLGQAACWSLFIAVGVVGIFAITAIVPLKLPKMPISGIEKVVRCPDVYQSKRAMKTETSSPLEPIVISILH
jgi:hypothetical protein